MISRRWPLLSSSPGVRAYGRKARQLPPTESISAEDEAILAGYLERHGLNPQTPKEQTRRPKQKKS